MQNWEVKCKNLLLRHSEGELGSVETLNGFSASGVLAKLPDLENMNFLREAEIKKEKGKPKNPLWFFLYLFLITEASSLKAVLSEPPFLIPVDSVISHLAVGDIRTVSALVDCSVEDKGWGQLCGYPLQDESPTEKMSAKFPRCKVSSSGFFPTWNGRLLILLSLGLCEVLK